MINPFICSLQLSFVLMYHISKFQITLLPGEIPYGYTTPKDYILWSFQNSDIFSCRGYLVEMSTLLYSLQDDILSSRVHNMCQKFSKKGLCSRQIEALIQLASVDAVESTKLFLKNWYNYACVIRIACSHKDHLTLNSTFRQTNSWSSSVMLSILTL